MQSVKMEDLKKQATLEDVKVNIFQRMIAVENELKTVGKNLTVDTGRGNSYQAVSERDIIDAIKPLEKKYGIYSYPVKRSIISQDVLERENKNGKRLEFFLRIETTYRFVNADNPEEFIEMTTYADGVDSGDKATGKAMTYADKYALMKAYKISTGEDPDQEASKEYISTKSNQESILNELTQQWSHNRKRMDALGIDYRSEKVNAWICEKIKSDNHDACQDAGKMRKINEAYNALIKGKLAELDKQRGVPVE